MQCQTLPNKKNDKKHKQAIGFNQRIFKENELL